MLKARKNDFWQFRPCPRIRYKRSYVITVLVIPELHCDAFFRPKFSFFFILQKL